MDLAELHLPMSLATMREALDSGDSNEAPIWAILHDLMIEADVNLAWHQLLGLIDQTDDARRLCSIGVWIAEPVLQLGWRDLIENVHEAAKNRKFRQVLSCVILSDLPEDVEELFDSIRPEYGSDDDIGSRRA